MINFRIPIKIHCHIDVIYYYLYLRIKNLPEIKPDYFNGHPGVIALFQEIVHCFYIKKQLNGDEFNGMIKKLSEFYSNVFVMEAVDTMKPLLQFLYTNRIHYGIIDTFVNIDGKQVSFKTIFSNTVKNKLNGKNYG